MLDSSKDGSQFKQSSTLQVARVLEIAPMRKSDAAHVYTSLTKSWKQMCRRLAISVWSEYKMCGVV